MVWPIRLAESWATCVQRTSFLTAAIFIKTHKIQVNIVKDYSKALQSYVFCQEQYTVDSG